MRFAQVLHYLKTKLKASIDEIGILRTIQTLAVLVQGCWVVKSEILYPLECASDVNGVSGDQMQKARDFIVRLNITYLQLYMMIFPAQIIIIASIAALSIHKVQDSQT